MNNINVNDLIKNRRSIYPHQFNKSEISDDIIQLLLENANFAPTHKLTQPWRFKVLKKKAKIQLGEFLSTIYVENNPLKKSTDNKSKKIKQKCEDSSVVLMICMQRDKNKSVPEWEEIASTAMAVQNIWLSCSQFGIGCYWSSPKSINKINELIKLNEGERCLGFLYMGYFDQNTKLNYQRNSIDEKVEWIQDFKN